MATPILLSPVKHVYINQPFGVNYLDFYQKLGYKGHNGIDFRTKRGCAVYASHAGKVISAGRESGGGIIVEILSGGGEGYKTVYYHLLKTIVNEGDKVRAGQHIAYADNTGVYTTGDHLHFGLKLCFNGETLDVYNGYGGSVDPTPYFVKGWDDTPALKRYGRQRTWAHYQMEIKKAAELTRILRRLPTHEEINAVVYGYWDAEAIRNPALAYNWKYLTKPGMEKGESPFS